ncbi:MAG: cell division protein FtsQ/DivIB [Sulfuritalea sp.]|nr:cell division protein FtsQ/DivIB [Sulfuritalea sp.]
MAKVRTSGKNGKRQDRSGNDGFWERPMLINLLADALLLAAGVMLAWAGTMVLQRLPVPPLKQLVVVTPVDQVSRAQIEHAARNSLSGNFFSVNLDAARSSFERVPWVRSASLRRLWPDGVELTLEEHRAVARWTPQEGEPRLVNSRGEVFAAATDQALPIFAGPEGSASRVLERYREFSSGLAASGRRPVAVQLSAREAWQLRLDDGAVLELGREQAKHTLSERVNRFASHYAAASSAVRGHLHGVGVVDLRYPNGFALRGITAPSPEGKLRPPPPSPRPGAGVTARLPRLAGGAGGNSRSTAARHQSRLAVQSRPWAAGRGCCQLQAHAADASAVAA